MTIVRQNAELTMRLSFRLDEDSAEIWEKLRKRHEGRKDIYIMRELLRQESFRLQGNTKDDRLNEIKAIVTMILHLTKDQNKEIVTLLRQLVNITGVNADDADHG